MGRLQFRAPIFGLFGTKTLDLQMTSKTCIKAIDARNKPCLVAKAELLEERRQWILDYCQDWVSFALPHMMLPLNAVVAFLEDPENGKEFPEKCPSWIGILSPK